MIAWLTTDRVASPTSPVDKMSFDFRKSVSGAGVGAPSCVAVFDATNSSKERRQTIISKVRQAGLKVFFIESICEDTEIIDTNIKEVRVSLTAV